MKNDLRKELQSYLENDYVWQCNVCLSALQPNDHSHKVPISALTDAECAALLASDYRIARYVNGTLQPL